LVLAVLIFDPQANLNHNTLGQCIPNYVSRHTGVSSNILGMSQDFFKKAKNDQFFQIQKKGHETQFLNNICINWQPKYFLVCRENFLTQKCVANEKSLGDTALGGHSDIT